MNGSVRIRPMGETDLEAADRAHRLAFGTFFGLPDPARFRGDAEVVRTRWRTDPAACLAAALDGKVVGSGLGMDWGSAFILGPVTVLPELWGRGAARQLMDGLMALIAARPAVTLSALFTHPQSTKHIRLYESYGFMPQSLIGVFSKPITAAAPPVPGTLYAHLPAPEQERALADCRAIAAANYPGLDLTREIRAVAAQDLGDTVLLTDGGALGGFAICHYGAGSEAGSRRCFVKFAAVRPGAEAQFARLVESCEGLAASVGAERLIAGVNSGRRTAYKLLQGRGYRADLNGLAMHRPDVPGYDRPDVFVIDDWR
jgi:ribosomal protein S18 acetylase RimI-like enzyme